MNRYILSPLLFSILISLVFSEIGIGDEIDFTKQVHPILKKYCAGCHNEDDQEGDFAVHSYEAISESEGFIDELTVGSQKEIKLIKIEVRSFETSAENR